MEVKSKFIFEYVYCITEYLILLLTKYYLIIIYILKHGINFKIVDFYLFYDLNIL